MRTHKYGLNRQWNICKASKQIRFVLLQFLEQVSAECHFCQKTKQTYWNSLFYIISYTCLSHYMLAAAGPGFRDRKKIQTFLQFWYRMLRLIS